MRQSDRRKKKLPKKVKMRWDEQLFVPFLSENKQTYVRLPGRARTFVPKNYLKRFLKSIDKSLFIVYNVITVKKGEKQ